MASEPLSFAVIIPAAGTGKRFAGGESNRNKLEQELAGRPVFLRSVELFLNRDNVKQIIVAVNPHAVDEFQFRWGDKLNFHGVEVVPGGKVERWETVKNALAAVSDQCTHVAIHDAARPLATAKLIDRVFEAAKQYDAVTPAVPVSATLKKVQTVDQADDADKDPLDAILGSVGKPITNMQHVVETIDRTNLVAVQTPQAFAIDLLRRAYADVGNAEVVTDDAALIEALGEMVYVVEGETTNLKITVPADMELAVAIAEKRQATEASMLAKKRLFGDDDED